MIGLVIDSRTGEIVREATDEERIEAISDAFNRLREDIVFYGYNVPENKKGE